MIIKTKKVQLSEENYLKINFRKKLKNDTKIFICCIVLFLVTLILKKFWFSFFIVLGVALYIGFWFLQFFSVRYIEMSKIMFAPTIYEISKEKILCIISSNQGFNIKWNQIKKVEYLNQDFILRISHAQILYIPYKSFNCDYDLNFFKFLLKDNKLISA
jgi:hypothetical protein